MAPLFSFKNILNNYPILLWGVLTYIVPLDLLKKTVVDIEKEFVCACVRMVPAMGENPQEKDHNCFCVRCHCTYFNHV